MRDLSPMSNLAMLNRSAAVGSCPWVAARRPMVFYGTMTNVPLLDLKAQFAQIRAEVMPVIDQVCASQHFILGEHVRALEEEAAPYSAASAGIGVSSGTDALLLALMAFN